MNIFFLDEDPFVAAKYHCDKHVVKMIVESAQMLSTAHRFYHKSYADSCGFYRSTHVNHPHNKWVRENSINYQWLYYLYLGLLNEYTHRYGKIHASAKFAHSFVTLPLGLHVFPGTEPDWDSVPLAMPDDCKVPDDPIMSYREYYIKYKAHFAKWKNGCKPFWWSKR